MLLLVLFPGASPCAADCVFPEGNPPLYEGVLIEVSDIQKDFEKREFCWVTIRTSGGKKIRGVTRNYRKPTLCKLSPQSKVQVSTPFLCCDTGYAGDFGCGIPTRKWIAVKQYSNETVIEPVTPSE